MARVPRRARGRYWPGEGEPAAPVLAERQERALVLEEEPLQVDPATEAGERAVRADDTVAGQDDWQRVAPVRGADRSRGVASKAEPARLLAVAHRLPVRNGRKCEPAAALELRSLQLERQVERHEVAGEVGVDLACGLGEDGRILRSWNDTARRPVSDAIRPSGPMGLSTTVPSITQI